MLICRCRPSSHLRLGLHLRRSRSRSSAEIARNSDIIARINAVAGRVRAAQVMLEAAASTHRKVLVQRGNNNSGALANGLEKKRYRLTFSR